MAQGQRRMIERVEPRFEPDGGESPGRGDDLRVTREDRPAPAPIEQRNRAPVRAKSARAKGRGWSLFGGSASRGDTPSRRRAVEAAAVRAARAAVPGAGARCCSGWSIGASCCASGACSAPAGVVAWYVAHLPPYQDLSVPDRAPNIQIVSADGELLANRGKMGGEAVSLKDLPRLRAQAFIAIEDRRFYSHFGIDPIGLGRAPARQPHGRSTSTQGGSTLTQQLAKNLFLTPDQHLGRKVQEALLALWLEHKYTKDQILELYLQPGVFRRRRLWHRGGVADLFRQVGQATCRWPRRRCSPA